MLHLQVKVGDLETNCYLLSAAAGGDCLVIDPGADAPKILARIASEKLIPKAVLLTHGHPDHMGAAAELIGRFHVPLWVHEADEAGMHCASGRGLAAMFGIELPPPASRLLTGGDVIAVGGMELTVLHSPGHTPGSILLHGDGVLFTGDTLFKGDVGRTDLPGGDEGELQRSLERIRQLPPRTVILPGHGDSSVLELELKYNPYF